MSSLSSVWNLNYMYVKMCILVPQALYVEEFPFHTSNSISPFLSLLKFFICFSHSSRQFTILITVVVNYLSVYFYIGFISESGPVDCLVFGIMFCFVFFPLFLS